MKGSSGILLVAVGILLLYVILSDKYQCFTEFFDCMTGADMRTPEGFTKSTTGATPPTTKLGGFDPYKSNVFDLWNWVMGKQ